LRIVLIQIKLNRDGVVNMNYEIFRSTALVDTVVNIVCDYAKNRLYEIDGHCQTNFGRCMHAVRPRIVDRVMSLFAEEILEEFYVRNEQMRKHLMNPSNPSPDIQMETDRPCNGMILMDINDAYDSVTHNNIYHVAIQDMYSRNDNETSTDMWHILQTLPTGKELVIYHEDDEYHYMRIGNKFVCCIVQN
jgi:hypothetical protein